MQKKFLLIVSTVGIVISLTAGAYYVAIFLPQKQKASIEKVRSKLEAKMEQEKAERLKIDEEKQALEDEKQRQANEAQQKADEEAAQAAALKAQQQKTSGAALKKCLDTTEATYKQRINSFLDDCEYPACTATIINTASITFQNIRTKMINECHKKY